MGKPDNVPNMETFDKYTLITLLRAVLIMSYPHLLTAVSGLDKEM